MRAALAAEIEKLTRSRADFAEASTAASRLDEQLSGIYAEMSEIEDEIRQAGAGQREAVMASVMRGDAMPGNDRLTEAEARKAAAERRKAAIQQAQEVMRETLRQRGDTVRMSESNVADARTAILWEALPAVVAAATPLRIELAKLASVVSLIGQGAPVGMSSDDPRRHLMFEAQRILAPILSNDAALPPADIGAWTTAAHSLLTDPDAPLPGMLLPFSNAA
ncbi:hypothetical protein MKK58_09450 [Methylobacterium sp. J-078]|uniref:hypothetical protein n=1 Tax=Methylobacterium sp. J-078 TaxID=2836657 RepID=UPI001FB8E18C|nr:hypothetical protein [Methylobacterium sp. J-078]MCJ2044751.1 hypothetical protein [Methylobacterium sp. J-078]